MVRNYQRKKKASHYSQEELCQAAKAVEDGAHFIRGAAEAFNVPYETLRRWLPTHLLILEVGQRGMSSAEKRKN